MKRLIKQYNMISKINLLPYFSYFFPFFLFNFQVMSLMDPKTVNMFYFTGSKHTTPNCPVDLKPDLNPSSGAQSYLSSNKDCKRSASYYLPFFLERMGPRFSEWSINAHEARSGHHLQVNDGCMIMISLHSDVILIVLVPMTTGSRKHRAFWRKLQ
jgi:hypothetical protein